MSGDVLSDLLRAVRLRGSDAKLIEIAQDVGSESEAAFSRAFKRMVGVTPGEWRMKEAGTGRGAAAPQR